MTLRRTPIARKTELAAGNNPLRRKKGMSRIAKAKRTVAKQRKQRDTGPDQATKAMLWQRAAGRCELCGCPVQVFSRHHRRPRGSGGSSVEWINDITNLLLVCGTGITGCHGLIERNRSEAYDAGWLIRYSSAYTPAELPVLIWSPSTGYDLVYLTSDGCYAKGIA